MECSHLACDSGSPPHLWAVEPGEPVSALVLLCQPLVLKERYQLHIPSRAGSREIERGAREVAVSMFFFFIHRSWSLLARSTPLPASRLSPSCQDCDGRAVVIGENAENAGNAENSKTKKTRKKAGCCTGYPSQQVKSHQNRDATTRKASTK